MLRSRRHSTLRLVLWSVAVITCSTAALASLLPHSLAPHASPQVVVTPPPAQGDGEPSHSRRVVVVYITRSGFEPAETHASAGDQVLMIRNNSGLRDLSVTARGLAIAPIGTAKTDAPPAPDTDVNIPVEPGGRGTNRFVRLTPGEVTLTEPGHPDWRCVITVDP
jgi:plastocyanin